MPYTPQRQPGERSPYPSPTSVTTAFFQEDSQAFTSSPDPRRLFGAGEDSENGENGENLGINPLMLPDNNDGSDNESKDEVTLGGSSRSTAPSSPR